MPEQRRRFSAQFKAEAVQMVIETEKPVAEVARDLGVNAGTLANWVNAWRRENPGSEQPVSPSERARVAEMEDEIRRLRMENEFLKKAAGRTTGRGYRARPDAATAKRPRPARSAHPPHGEEAIPPALPAAGRPRRGRG